MAEKKEFSNIDVVEVNALHFPTLCRFGGTSIEIRIEIPCGDEWGQWFVRLGSDVEEAIENLRSFGDENTSDVEMLLRFIAATDEDAWYGLCQNFDFEDDDQWPELDFLICGKKYSFQEVKEMCQVIQREMGEE